MTNWTPKFWLDMAEQYAQGSKDPGMKVGCVIVRPDRTAASWGCNGFPRGIEDTEERLTDRDMKLSLTIHAETNALLFAKESVAGYTLYCTFCPCIRCAVNIIQSGIKEVVFKENKLNDRWRESQAKSIAFFKEAGVAVYMLHEDGSFWGSVLKQSKKDSLIESLLHVSIGFILSILMYAYVIGPVFGIETDPLHNLGVVGLFTITSLARQLIIRRLCDGRQLWDIIKSKLGMSGQSREERLDVVKRQHGYYERG